MISDYEKKNRYANDGSLEELSKTFLILLESKFQKLILIFCWKYGKMNVNLYYNGFVVILLRYNIICYHLITYFGHKSHFALKAVGSQTIAQTQKVIGRPPPQKKKMKKDSVLI